MRDSIQREPPASTLPSTDAPAPGGPGPGSATSGGPAPRDTFSTSSAPGGPRPGGPASGDKAPGPPAPGAPAPGTPAPGGHTSGGPAPGDTFSRGPAPGAPGSPAPGSPAPGSPPGYGRNGPGKADAEFFEHEVQPGQSLAGIAKMHGVPVARLREANPGLEKVSDTQPLNRRVFRVLKVPLRKRGTTVTPGLPTDKRHELQAPHRFAVVFAAAQSDLVALFDHVQPDGDLSRDVLAARFDIHYHVPEGVKAIHWAAALLPEGADPLARFTERPGYAQEGHAPLKPRAAPSTQKAEKADLEAALKEAEGGLFLKSGEEALSGPGKTEKAIRLYVADEDAARFQAGTGTAVVIPWTALDLSKVKPDKKYCFWLLASNGKSAIDGAASGYVKLIRVTIAVEGLLELVPGVAKERGFEVRLHDAARMPVKEAMERELFSNINYCTDSRPLTRPADYKEKLKDLLGEKVFASSGKYEHKAAKVVGDQLDHAKFEVDIVRNEIDVPPNLVLKLLDLSKGGVLDRVTIGGARIAFRSLAFQKSFYPTSGGYLAIRLFYHSVARTASDLSAAEVERLEKDCEAKEKALEDAEKELRRVRETKARGESGDRDKARRAALRKERTRLEDEAADLDRALAEAIEEADPSKRDQGESGELAKARLALDGKRAELARLWREHKDDLKKADEEASSAAGADAEKATREAREKQADEQGAAAAKKWKEADEALTRCRNALAQIAKIEDREVIPYGAPGGDGAGAAFRESKDRIVPGAPTIVALFDDEVEKALAIYVDGEKWVDGGNPRRRIRGSRDATYLEPPPPEGAAPPKTPDAIRPRQIRNTRWDRKKARNGDTVKLFAFPIGFEPGTPAKIRIHEKDETSPDDFVKEIASKVGADGVSLEAEWRYEYKEDTDDNVSAAEKKKGYTTPEYYFEVEVLGVKGRSGLLEFRDFFEFRLVDVNGKPIANAPYKITFPDSKTVREGKTDADGKARLEDVPPGNSYQIELPRTPGSPIGVPKEVNSEPIEILPTPGTGSGSSTSTSTSTSTSGGR